MGICLPSDKECAELVLCGDEVSKKAHKELYSFVESRYVISAGDLLEEAISLACGGAARLHIVSVWTDILRVSLWSAAGPPVFDALSLLGRSGVSAGELAPFRNSEVADLFPWLYYGRKFDVLRRICNAAKAKTEAKVNRKDFRAYCHLVSPDVGRIVASSL
jgi:hypothetical protein